MVDPPIRPSARGPCKCGHSAWVAKTSPECVRKTAIRRPPAANTLPSPAGIWATLPITILVSMSRALRGNNGGELIGGLRRGCFLPRIVSSIDRGLHCCVKRGRDSFAVLDHHRSDSFNSHTFD